MTYIRGRHLVAMNQQPRGHCGQQLCPVALKPVIAACLLLLMGTEPVSLEQKSELVESELNTKHYRGEAPAQPANAAELPLPAGFSHSVWGECGVRGGVRGVQCRH